MEGIGIPVNGFLERMERMARHNPFNPFPKSVDSGFPESNILSPNPVFGLKPLTHK
jgi:hypothetical protein